MARMLVHIDRMPMRRMSDRKHKIKHGTILGRRARRHVPILLKHPRSIRKRVPNGRIELRDDGLEQRARRVCHRQDLVAAECSRERAEHFVSVRDVWSGGGVET